MTRITLYAVANKENRVLSWTAEYSRKSAIEKFLRNVSNPKPWREERKSGYRTVKLECTVKE